MAVAIPILSVKNDANGDPPTFWCLPAWHGIVDYYDSKYRKVFFRTPCNDEEECSIDPEKLRALVEAQLKKHPAWGGRAQLTLDAYTVARNIQSEFGDGTPSERASIGLAAVNRAVASGGARSITEGMVHRERGTYGRQLGSIRPASTRQDPSLANILLADMIVKGQITDFTGGATHYLDRMVQDVMHRKNPNTPDGETVYLDWTGGGDYLTWVGLIPNVRAWRLALMSRRSDLRPRTEDSPQLRAEKISARAKIRAAGQKAILGKNRAPAPWDTCAEAAVAAASSISGAAVGPALTVVQDREGLATVLFCVAMSGIAGVAAASLGRPRRRRSLGSVDWLKYGDPERWSKLMGPVRLERTADAFDMGHGELKVLAKIGDTTVGELEAFTIPDSRHVTIDKIVVGPRGRGIGTTLYEHAARWACARARKPLASDEKRSEAATGFWKKQVRKKRATCTWRLTGEEARSVREEESIAHPEAPIWARGGCVRYALKTCHAPISLAGHRGR